MKEMNLIFLNYMITRTLFYLFCSLIIKEESMTQDDEEFMLDNFVTFFIAGEFLFFLLWCVEKKICALRKDLSNRCSRLKRLLETRGVLIVTVNRKLEILDGQCLDVNGSPFGLKRLIKVQFYTASS